MRIALHVVATGRYISFIPSLLNSIRKHFLAGHEVSVFVRTDGQLVSIKEGAVRIPGEWIPWPLTALLKYHYLLRTPGLENFDSVYNLDADSLLVDTVGNEILGDLVGVLHPAFCGGPRERFTYETRSDSAACINPEEGKAYYMSSFFGGSRGPFWEMVRRLEQAVESDLRKNIIALWFDESHLNRYFCDHPPDVSLSPSYSSHLGWGLPWKQKIVHVSKNNAEIRQPPQPTLP